MTKFIAAVLTAAFLLGSAVSLSACRTTSGFGQDVSATGQAVTDTARKATP